MPAARARRGAWICSGASGRVAVAGVAVALASCHVCPREDDCDRWSRLDHEQPLRAAEAAVAVGAGGALAVAVEEAEFPFFRYEPRDAGTDADLHGVFALGSIHPMCPYVVVGDRGTIRVSDDLGETWHAPTSPATAAALRGLAAHCPFRIGIAVGDDGTVLVASGDPETWRARASGTDQRLQAVALARPVAVAVGDGGTIVRSGDEGETWAPVLVDTTADLRTVALTSSGGGPAMGMIGAADGALLVSRDDGETWERINPGFTPPIRQVHVGAYEVGGATRLSATILAEGGLWAWHEAEGGLMRTHWLDLPAYAFTDASAPGGPSALTVLVDGAAIVYRYCMGCD